MKGRRSISRLSAEMGRRLNMPGGYQVSGVGPVPVRRPNRGAAGMQFTTWRRKGRPLQPGDHISRDALGLIVNGTTDALRSLRAWHTELGKCPCCGAKSRGLVLTDSGKARLRRARRRAAERKRAAQ